MSAADTIDSGRVDVAVDLTLDGVSQLDGRPISLQISGPFSRGPGHQLSADLTLTLSAAQSNVTAGLVIVGGTAYLGLGGHYYKIDAGPRSAEGATGATGATGGDGGILKALRGLGLDPRSWLSSPHIVGRADVGGVTTQHLHALINVPHVVDDLAALIGPIAGGATGATGTSGARGASGPAMAALMLIESAITSATVDVYTGVGDHVVRRVQIAIAFTVPSIASGALDGLTGGSLNIEATLTDLNQPQSISPPADAQPESKLINGVLALESQFGALAPLVKQFGAAVGLGAEGGASGGLFSADHGSGPATGEADTPAVRRSRMSRDGSAVRGAQRATCCGKRPIAQRPR